MPIVVQMVPPRPNDAHDPGPRPTIKPEAAMRLQLLGGARALVDQGWISFLPERSYQLLAYLAYQADWVGRDKLAFLFWPDHPEGDARRNLRKIILRAREFEWAGLEADPKALRWVVPTDVAEFRQAIQQQRWAQAVALYRGRLLKGMDQEASPEFVGWIELEGAHLHAEWREALLAQAGELEQQGNFEAAATFLRQGLFSQNYNDAAMKLTLTKRVLRSSLTNACSKSAENGP